MKSSEHLNAIADFFQNGKNNWTRLYSARDKDGNGCEPDNLKAVSFCALGAARLLVPREEWYPRVRGYLTNALPPNELSLPVYNDEVAHGKRDIIRLYRRAAKLAAKAGD